MVRFYVSGFALLLGFSAFADEQAAANVYSIGLEHQYMHTGDYAFQATYFETLDADNVVEVEYAFTLGLTYRF